MKKKQPKYPVKHPCFSNFNMGMTATANNINLIIASLKEAKEKELTSLWLEFYSKFWRHISSEKYCIEIFNWIKDNFELKRERR